MSMTERLAEQAEEIDRRLSESALHGELGKFLEFVDGMDFGQATALAHMVQAIKAAQETGDVQIILDLVCNRVAWFNWNAPKNAGGAWPRDHQTT